MKHPWCGWKFKRGFKLHVWCNPIRRVGMRPFFKPRIGTRFTNGLRSGKFDFCCLSKNSFPIAYSWFSALERPFRFECAPTYSSWSESSSFKLFATYRVSDIGLHLIKHRFKSQGNNQIAHNFTIGATYMAASNYSAKLQLMPIKCSSNYRTLIQPNMSCLVR